MVPQGGAIVRDPVHFCAFSRDALLPCILSPLFAHVLPAEEAKWLAHLQRAGDLSDGPDQLFDGKVISFLRPKKPCLQSSLTPERLAEKRFA